MNKTTSNNLPWSYYKKSADGKSGVCTVKNCSAVIQTKGGLTSGLHNHFKSQHAINLMKRDAVAAITDAVPTSSVLMKKITAYFSN